MGWRSASLRFGTTSADWTVTAPPLGGVIAGGRCVRCGGDVTAVSRGDGVSQAARAFVVEEASPPSAAAHALRRKRSPTERLPRSDRGVWFVADALTN